MGSAKDTTFVPIEILARKRLQAHRSTTASWPIKGR
jgi:hypothetical protein